MELGVLGGCNAFYKDWNQMEVNYALDLLVVCFHEQLPENYGSLVPLYSRKLVLKFGLHILVF